MPGIVPQSSEAPWRADERGGGPVLVACLGDVMLDVLVDTEHGLHADDDTPAVITFAAGGQAANVAAWVAALGGRSRIFGPRHLSGPGRLVDESLTRRGIQLFGGGVDADRPGAVVSLVSRGTRSMASDPGDLTWLDDVRSGAWLDGVDWLFVSGYALLRSSRPQRVIETAAVARAHGARIAVDLSSAAMVSRFGADEFSALCRSLRPSAVFANDAEWATSSGGFGAGGTAVLVLKHGPRGVSFVIDGIADDRPPRPGPILDVTGAGDALTAGFLLGGAELALEAAARCVSQRGAQPVSEQPDSPEQPVNRPGPQS
jgi:ribokinase